MLPLILVVDDERTIADTLTLILRHNGYRADAAYSGEEAIAYVSRNTPDLVVSDVVMPGMNGFELASSIRQEYPSKVLLISGNATTFDMIRDGCLKAQAIPLLPKPIHPADLLREVAKVLASASSDIRGKTVA